MVVLLVAAAFRFVGLSNVTPPGLEHDEVAHWLINRDILAGNHAIYFTDAYGHEALFHYVQAGFGALAGDNALALRLPAAYSGLLVVALGFALGRRLFGWPSGFWSAAFLAVNLWPVFYSRLALRAIALPALSGLAAVLWWAACSRREDGRGLSSVVLFGLSGVAAGLSLHTYMAARAVPIFFGLFTLYLAVFHRSQFRRVWRGIALFWLVYVVIAAPLVYFLATNPGAEARIGEVDAPLRALLAGDPRPVLENGLRILGMFGVRGDPLWRQNVAFLPTFDPLLGLLFYGGLALALWRWREPRHAFILLWLATSAIPSLVTVDAPSSIRIINALPVVMLFPLLFIHKMVELSTASDNLSTRTVTLSVAVLLGGLFIFHGWRTAGMLWRIWPANDEVRFVWQAALTDAAAYLDASSEDSPVAVGGWTPETMDPPTMELTLRREDLSLRYFNPAESLVLPRGEAGGEPARVVRPAILPFSPLLAAAVAPFETLDGSFARYAVPAGAAIEPGYAAGAVFDDHLRLLGYDAEGCAAGQACILLTYWEVLSSAGGPRRFFLHRVDAAGALVAQDDRLGAPAEHWRPGDLVLQELAVPPGAGELRLGVYDPATGRRLLTADGRDFIVIDER